MKKLSILLLLQIGILTSAQTTYIPDDNFEQALIDLGYDDIPDDYVLTSNIYGITSINLTNHDIFDLTGIEDFVSLTVLACNSNHLTNLDVSHNVTLEELYCLNNQLEILDLSQNTALKILYCGRNQLNNLFLSLNIDLRLLSCGDNKFQGLDLRDNQNLTELYCPNNQLRYLDLRHNTRLEILECSFNHLLDLDVRNGNNSLLLEFNATNNLISCIKVDNEVSANLGLPPYNNWQIDSDVNYQEDDICPHRKTYIPDDNFEQVIIDLELDDHLDNYVSTDQILDIYILDLSDRNISDLTGIEEFLNLRRLDCASNQLTSLDLSRNIALKELKCEHNALASLDLSHNVALEELYCSQNDLTRLDLSQNITLETLYCEYNDLSSLNITDNIALASIYCAHNQIQKLYVGNNVELSTLNCSDNKLIGLDLSHNNALSSLICSGNDLTSLNLTQNTLLTILICQHSDKLKNINIKNSNNTIISEFRALFNPLLTCIQVDNEEDAIANLPPYNSWIKDPRTNYSEDCSTVIKTLVNDANFERVLIRLGIDQDGIENLQITGDVSNIESLDISHENIMDLTGIQDFTGLFELYCEFNNLTSLDLSQNKALILLNCKGNNLVNLDVGQNIKLTYLDCQSNELSNLDVSHNLILTRLLCNDNKIRSLDLSQNTRLETLDCYSNQLLYLNARNGNNSLLLEFGATNNPLLDCINVDNETSANAGLHPYDNWQKDSSVSYSEKCPKLAETYVPDDNFEQALIDLGYDDVPDDYVNTMNILDVNSLELIAKNISDLTGIEDFICLVNLICYDNQLTSLDVTQNRELLSLDCSYNQLTNLSINSNLSKLTCTRNILTNLSNIENLDTLICNNNGIEELRINGTISVLSCDYNKIKELEIYSPFLKILSCSDNEIEELYLYVPYLTEFSCRDNLLEYIDLSHNQNLVSVDCSNNPLLRGLNVQNGNNNDIEEFQANYNPTLFCIQVDNIEDANSNKTPYNNWRKDPTAVYSEDCINKTYIPDERFEQELIDKKIDNIIDGYVFTSNISGITSLDVSHDIMDLTGIEDFISLEQLHCEGNQLSNLDVSHNKNLTFLDCNNNSLYCLDLRNENNENIYLNAAMNQLKCISVDDEAADHSSWQVDEGVIFSNDCDGLYVYIPDPNFEGALIEQGIDSKGILDHWLFRSDAEAVTSLDVHSKEIEDLTGIEAFINLIYLNCSSNLLSELNISNIQSLQLLVSNNNNLNELNVSQNLLLQRISCNNNLISSLNVSQHTGLLILECGGNDISDLDISNNTLLNTLDCSNNPLGTLDVSNNPALERLYCGSNQLSTLDISQNPALIYLYCSYNPLGQLDVSNNTALEFIHCAGNNLESLDVSLQPEMFGLFCYENSMESLDLTSNPKLTELWCRDNRLYELNIKNGNNANVTAFEADENLLSCITVDDELADHTGWIADPGVIFSNDCGYNTQRGESVAVLPEDETSLTTPVEVIFDDVNLSGNTSLITDETGPEIPGGFAFGDPLRYYDISTTAEFSGPVQIAIDYSGMVYANEEGLRLMHYEEQQWMDVTTLLDTENDMIYGEVTSLSPFGVLADIETPVFSETSDIIINDPGPTGAYVEFEIPTATDNSPGVIVEQTDGTGLTSGSFFPLGATTLSYQATDVAGNTATCSFNVILNNLPPVIDEIIAPVDPISLGTEAIVTVLFTDDNLVEATIYWGDGTGPVYGDITDQTITWNYTYPAPGVYAVSVQLVDIGGKTAEETYRYMVVFDPDGGILTGQGRIESPVGAYLPDPLFEGQAIFRILSTYPKDGTIPVGTARFYLCAGDLLFWSNQLDWLVINDSKVKLKGSGIVNGSVNCGFVVSAIDINHNWFRPQDIFRMIIWDKSNDEIIYDNEFGTELYADPVSVIKRGFVTIYNPNCDNHFKSTDEFTFNSPVNNMPEMLIYPNPAKDYMNIEIKGNDKISSLINIYNIKGELIYSAERTGNYTERLSINEYQPGLYMVTCIINDKLIQQKVIIE